MENQGVAGALQLSQEVDDDCLGRRVFNLHSTTSVKQVWEVRFYCFRGST